MSMIQGSNSLSRNLYIHGLRGLLAFLIFLFHVADSGLATYVSDVLAFIFGTFEFGVELFFGISGIVIVYAFSKSRKPMAFLYDRASRIFPVLWATVLTIVVLGQFQSDKVIPSTPLDIAANLLALPPIIPLPIIHPAAWSISYEFAFYGMFVLFAVCSSLFSTRTAFLIALTAGLLLLSQHLRAACFMSGMAIAYGLLDRPIKPSIKIPSGLLLTAALSLWHLAALQLHNDVYDFKLLAMASNPLASLLYIFAFAAATIGLLGISRGQGWLAQLLLTRPMQFLGTISFSFYLWQTIVMAIVKKGMYMLDLPAMLEQHSQLAFALLSLPPSIIISYVSYQLLEVRATNWMRGKSQSKPVIGV